MLTFVFYRTLGNATHPTNINSKTRPTVELPDGKEEVAYESEAEHIKNKTDAIDENGRMSSFWLRVEF